MLEHGLVMDRQVLISSVIYHAESQHGDVEIVSRETHGPLFRYRYADCAKRTRQLANVLRALKLVSGDRVATIAWNNHRHLEAYFAVSGGGMVLHTCNPRLHPEQLAYIINHAEDRVVLFDSTFAPLVNKLASQCANVNHWICLSDQSFKMIDFETHF